MSTGPATFDPRRYGPQEQAPVERKPKGERPIYDNLDHAATMLRNALIEPKEIHMTRGTHDALLAELGVPYTDGLRLESIHGMRIVIK